LFSFFLPVRLSRDLHAAHAVSVLGWVDVNDGMRFAWVCVSDGMRFQVGYTWVTACGLPGWAMRVGELWHAVFSFANRPMPIFFGCPCDRVENPLTLF